MQALIAKLVDNVKISLESSKLSDKQMQDLLLKLSKIENESKELVDRLKSDVLKRHGSGGRSNVKESYHSREQIIGSVCGTLQNEAKGRVDMTSNGSILNFNSFFSIMRLCRLDIAAGSKSYSVYGFSWIYEAMAAGIYAVLAYVCFMYYAKSYVYYRLVQFLAIILAIFVFIALLYFTKFSSVLSLHY